MVTVGRKVFNKPCEASQRDFYVIIIAVTHQFPFATVESKLSGVSSSTLDASAVQIDSTAAKKVPNFITQPETRTKMEMEEPERGVVG